MKSRKLTQWETKMVLSLLFAIMLGIFLAVSFITHNFTYALSSLITVCIALIAFASQTTKPKQTSIHEKKASRI